MADDEKARARVAYTGQRITQRGPVVHRYEFAGGPRDREGILLAKPIGGAVGVGTILEADFSPDLQSVYRGSGTPVGDWSDPETVAGWKAAHEATRAEVGRKAAIRKAGDERALEGLVEPLRAAAAKMTRNERRALAVWLMQELGL